MKTADVIVYASASHRRGALSSLKKELLRGIRAAGLDLAETDAPTPGQVAASLVLTGGVERQVLKGVAGLPSPILLVAHSGNGSLPAALEILARIRHDGGEGRVLFGPAEEIAAEFGREIAVADAWNALRFTRVGLVGDASDRLVASDVDRAFVKGRLAIELVEIAFEDLVRRIEPEAVTKRAIERFAETASSVVEPDEETLRGAVAIYDALRGLVDEHRLAACSVRCLDLIKRVENTACYALSRLNDEGVPAGCEGDLQSLFTLYLAHLLSGRTALMANVVSVDQTARTIALAHCTCPLSLAASYAIRSHFESGIGVGISGSIPTGACTVFRLGGERLDHLFVREGEIEDESHRNDLCRTQVRVHCDERVDALLTAPLGNHHVLLAGRHRAAIERFFVRYLSS